MQLQIQSSEVGNDGARQETSKRKSYLDGLRGVAAVAVFLGHLLIALLPAAVTISIYDSHSPFDLWIAFMPVGFLWNGNFGVCIFFILSGYVLAEFSTGNDLTFGATAVRRYLRLALPMAIVAFGAWALLRAGAFHNSPASEITHSGWLGGWYRFEPSFIGMLREAFYSAFLSGSNDYDPNFWTMRIEIQGSLYVFMLFALFRTRRARLPAIAIFALFQYDQYLMLFAAGCLIFDWEDVLYPRLKHVAWLLLIAGLLLGSAPAIAKDYEVGSAWLAAHGAPLWYLALHEHVFLSALRHAEMVHEIGAAALFLGVIFSGRARLFLESRIPAFLGRISFTLYLIHIPIICSVTSWFVTSFARPGDNYYFTVGRCAVLTMALVLALAAFCNDVVDRRMIRISRQAGRALDGA